MEYRDYTVITSYVVRSHKLQSDARAIVIGDSIVHQWLLSRLNGVPTVNAGLSGATPHDIAALSEILISMGCHRFDTAVLLGGVNVCSFGALKADGARQRALDSCDLMVSWIRKLAETVHVLEILPVGDMPNGIGTPYIDVSATKEMNGELRRCAANHGARFVETAAYMAREDGVLVGEYTVDGLHLSAKGYAALRKGLAERGLSFER